MTDDPSLKARIETAFAGWFLSTAERVEALRTITTLVVQAVAAEREACAKIAEAGIDTPHPMMPEHTMESFGRSPWIAAAIRARSTLRE